MKGYLLLPVLLCALLPGAPSSVLAQIDLGAPTARTPYDAYMGPMWAVLRQLNGPKADPQKAAQLVRQGHGFQYCYKKDQPYVPQPPDQTEATKSGDCKAKALWVASKLNDPNVRFVIGKAKLVQDLSHAWLIWNGPEGWIILDATLYSSPLSPSRVSPREFIPTYSFAPNGKFSHRLLSSAAGTKSGDHL